MKRNTGYGFAQLAFKAFSTGKACGAVQHNLRYNYHVMRKNTYTHVQAQTHPLSLHTQTYTHLLNLFILEAAASQSFHGINQEPPTQGRF